MVRATNWLGDAVMSLPAMRAIRQTFPHAHIAVVARPSVADLYERETAIDRVIVYASAQALPTATQSAGCPRGLPKPRASFPVACWFLARPRSVSGARK